MTNHQLPLADNLKPIPPRRTLEELLFDNIDRITAAMLVLGTMILIGGGVDSELKSILAIAAGWLFGSSYQKARISKPKP